MSTRSRQLAGAALLLMLFTLTLGILGSAGEAPADFVFNNGAEIQSLDPATITGIPEGRVLRAIFEGLVVMHPRTLEPVPGVAESWQVSDDRKTYTFRIRANARWSNGDPVTAQDFIYSWERLLNPATAAEYAYQLWYVRGARAYTHSAPDALPPFDSVGLRALDDSTLEIELEQPTPFFLDLLSFYALFPIHPASHANARERFGDGWEYQWLKPEHLVTNGPFRIVERRVNDRIRLLRNDRYWDVDNVALRSIDVLAVDSYSTGLNLYLTGQADWIDRVPMMHAARLMQREDFKPRTYLGSYFFRLNVTRGPLRDPRVRRALSLTVPRQEICDKITQCGQTPIYGLVPPGISAYQSAATPPASEESARLEAQSLLAAAGFGPGGTPFPTIEIHYNHSEAHRDIAEVIGTAWRRHLGVRVKFLNQEWKVYLDTQSSLDYDISRSAWIGDYVDPNSFLDLFVTGGENNKTGWGDPEYDALLRRAALELAPTRRMELLQQAERLLLEAMPIIPVFTYASQNLVSPRLGGFHENILDVHFPKFWYWMDDAELTAVRAAYPSAAPGESFQHVRATGPARGLYSLAAQRLRVADRR
ncbi:MAG: peptide ABC transporter substrate-binding protein [Planctomycetota bacterium]